MPIVFSRLTESVRETAPRSSADYNSDKGTLFVTSSEDILLL